MTHTRTQAAILASIFLEGPIFRMGFDAHVKAWKKATARDGFRLFNTDPAFRAEYHARGGQLGVSRV